EQLAAQLERERAAADEAARLAVIRRAQLDAARGVAGELPAFLDAVDASVNGAKLRLAAAEAERSKQHGGLAGLRAQEIQLRERLAALSENVHGLEMQVYEKKLHLSQLIERAAEELGLEEEVLVAEYGPGGSVARVGEGEVEAEAAEPSESSDSSG